MITLGAGEDEITSQPFIRYPGIMIDIRLNFKEQVEHASRKAILASVVMLVLTYSIAIWDNTLRY